jgi:hypothetical protein
MSVQLTNSSEVLAVMLRLMNMTRRSIESNGIIIRQVHATFGVDVETTTIVWSKIVEKNVNLPVFLR